MIDGLVVWWSGDGERWKKKKKGKSTTRAPEGPPVAMMVMIYRAEVNPAGPELGELKTAVVPLIHQFVLDNIMILKF